MQAHGTGILGKLSFAGLTLSPTLRKPTIYVALMLLGIGAMLIVAGLPTSDTATAIQGWGAAFIVLSVVLLVVVGVSAVGGKLFGIISRDLKAELANDSNDSPSISEASNPPDGNELSDTERALLKSKTGYLTIGLCILPFCSAC